MTRHDTDRLTGVIAALAAPVGAIAVTTCAWHSATFIGKRCTLRFMIAASCDVERLTAAIGEADFALAKLLVADADVTLGRIIGEYRELIVEVLLVELN